MWPLLEVRPIHLDRLFAGKNVGKLKEPRHWLRSSRQLLRESQRRGYVYRRGPRCDFCFRSSKPRRLLAELSVFSGLAVEQVAPLYESPSLLQIGNDIEANPFSHRCRDLSASSEVVNARFLCNQRAGVGSLKAPNGLPVKAFADGRKNPPQHRFCRPVEMFS